MTPDQWFLVIMAGMFGLTLLACVAALLTATQVGQLRALISSMVEALIGLISAHTATTQELATWIKQQQEGSPPGPQELKYDRPARVLAQQPPNDEQSPTH